MFLTTAKHKTLQLEGDFSNLGGSLKAMWPKHFLMTLKKEIFQHLGCPE